MIDWESYGISIPWNARGIQVKTICPHCKDTRHNPNDRSLSCNTRTGMFHCHHCGWEGCADDEMTVGNKNILYLNKTRHMVTKTYKKPTGIGNQKLSDKLLAYWAKRGISEKTLVDMKVTEGKIFVPQKNAECNTVQFNYYKNGEHVNTKYRTGDKCFVLCKDAELVPYNIDAIKDTTECIIVEGEADCLSFIECGKTNCISVPNGANANLSYLDDFISTHFENKEVIYIASDTDEKGVLLRHELLRRLGSDVCKVVTYGEGCKDANEHLVKYGKESLLKCLEDAEYPNVDGIVYARDIMPELDLLYHTGLKKGKTIGHDDFDNLISWETKRVCVITGIPSSGKTEFLNEIAERLNMRYGWKFAFFSPETQPLACHVSNIIEKITGKTFSEATMSNSEFKHVADYIDDEFFFISPKKDFTLNNILSKARVLVRRKGIKGLIIDPYNRLENEQEGSMSETQYISQVLDKLLWFAQKYEVLVFLMAHPTKMPKSGDKKVGEDGKITVPNLYDISGSAHFYNKADYGIVVHRHRDLDYTEVRVEKVKMRHLGHAGSVFFKYNTVNGRYVPYYENQVPVWDNETHFGRWRGDFENQEFEEKQQIRFPESRELEDIFKIDEPFGQPINSAPF